MGPRDGSLEVEPGITLHYAVQGDGPEVLLVPSAAWLARPLAPLARGRRLVCYDLRGRGRSSPVDDPARLGIALRHPTFREGLGPLLSRGGAT